MEIKIHNDQNFRKWVTIPWCEWERIQNLMEEQEYVIQYLKNELHALEGNQEVIKDFAYVRSM